MHHRLLSLNPILAAFLLPLSASPLRSADTHGSFTPYFLFPAYAQTIQDRQSIRKAYSPAKRSQAKDFADQLLQQADQQVQTNQYQTAIQSYQQALTIYRKIRDQDGETRVLSNLGLAYAYLSQYGKAIEFYRQALSILRQVGDHNGEAMALDNLGKAYSSLSQYGKAIEFYQQALSIFQQVGDRDNEALTFSNIGQLLESQKQPELAIVFYKQSVNVRESIRQEIRSLPRDLQESYTQTAAGSYRRLADLLLKQDRVLEAQQVLDLLKVQELKDYLRTVRGTPQPIDFLRPEAEILKQYNALQASAIELGQEFAQLRKIPASQRTAKQQQRITQLVQLEKDLNNQFNNFTRSPEVTMLVQQLSYTTRDENIKLEGLNALRDDLQRSQAVLLYPLILEDRLELVITTPESAPLRRIVKVKREALNATVLEFRRALQNPGEVAKARKLGQQLYTWLIQPLENDLKQANTQTIIYAPDGQLRYIPLAALHDGNQWLVQRYRINNITAKSLMGNRFKAQLPTNPRVLAGAFADQTANYSVTVGQRRFSFSGLPYAKREVANVAATIPNTIQLIDKAFSLAAVEPRMNEHNILHFATHAAFVSGDPSESFIMFGDSSTATLRDIESWSLQNVDLVVLSACETGLGGKLGNGEEILGLGYQFQNRGAKATIATLWAVLDDGTQVLMDDFYAGLRQGMPKAEALRQAQVSLISSGRYRHPLFWAPFVLIGNGL